MYLKTILYKFLYLFFLFVSLNADNSWKVYDDSEMAIINISIDHEDLEWMYQWENVESDSVHPATIHFQNSYIDQIIDSVGFRLRGNTSRTSAKKSFKVDLNHFVPGRNLYGVEKLNLNGEHNDPSIVRSKLSWDFFQRVGMKSSRAAHAKVYINGDYYGLYVSVEHIDDTFISRNYNNENGNLWKCLWPADLTYRGNNSEDYYPYFDEKRPYELKTNRDEYDYSKLVRLIKIIHQSPDSLELVLDIKDALQYFAMNIITGGWDDYRFLRNNYYLYHNPTDDLIHWIPYDYDNTLSIDWFDIDWSSIDPYEYAVIDNDGRPLTDYLFSQDRYRDLFSHFLLFYSNQLLDMDALEIKLDGMLENLSLAAEEDEYRTYDYGFSMDDFIQSYGYEFEMDHVKQGMLEFFSNRKSSLNEQIVFNSSGPFIYDVDINNDILIVGDTIRFNISMYGNPTNFHLFYLKEGNQSWEHVEPVYSPNQNSNHIEDHDLWITNIIPDNPGVYYWYLLAGEENGGERFPIFDFKNFRVVEAVQGQPVIINELLAVNESINFDEDGEYDDWIEIHNQTDEVIDLTGFFLTDKEDNLSKWQFPESSSMIEPNGYLLVWCDEDQDQGPLHTNFKLSSSGEFVGLVSPDGETLIDAISFPQQDQDISYGRSSQNQEQWEYLTPSPGESNSGLKLAEEIFVEDFRLDKLYPNPFNSKINLSLHVKEPASDFRVDLISLTGQVVKSKSFKPFASGDVNVSINLTNQFASGCYLLRVISSNSMVTRKVLYLK